MIWGWQQKACTFDDVLGERLPILGIEAEADDPDGFAFSEMFFFWENMAYFQGRFVPPRILGRVTALINLMIWSMPAPCG